MLGLDPARIPEIVDALDGHDDRVPHASRRCGTGERPNGSPTSWSSGWRVIDLHTHILPGIDDGARTLDDALEMARAFVGGRRHHGRGHATCAGRFPDLGRGDAARGRQAAAAARRDGDPSQRSFPEPSSRSTGSREWTKTELRRLSLAGSGRYLLVETPYCGWPVELRRAASRPADRRLHAGARPSGAQSVEVQATPALLAPLVRGGTLVQVTAASLDGRLGSASRRRAFHLDRSRDSRTWSRVTPTRPTCVRQGCGQRSMRSEDPALADWLVRRRSSSTRRRSAAPPPRPGRASPGGAPIWGVIGRHGQHVS